MSVGDISPRPLEEDDNTISELDDKEQVNKEPAQPGKKSTQFDHLKIGDGFVSTDSGIVPLSQYLNGFVGLLIARDIIFRAACSPDCMANGAIPGRGLPPWCEKLAT